MFGSRPLPRNFEASRRDLADDKPEVRADAAHDLARHADKHRDEVIEALAKALEDKEARVRIAAATGLADTHAEEATPALVAAADDDRGDVEAAIISALGEIGDDRAAARVERALSSSKPEVRFQAAIALPRVTEDYEKTLASLLAATRDDDAFVAHIALRMSEEMSEGDLDPRVVKRAGAMLDRGPAMARIAAAIILARAGEDKGAKILASVANGDLKTTDEGDEVAAIELCGELEVVAAKPGLERRAFGGFLGFQKDKLAWNSRVALARMGNERAKNEILAELQSWNRDRRTLAVAAAGKARLASARKTIAAMKGDAVRADPTAVDEALAALAE